MSSVRIALPLLLVAVAVSQWLLFRAKRTLSIEDKARVTDATFRPWWVMFVFAAIVLIWLWGADFIPRSRQWHWWSLVLLVVVIFVMNFASSLIRWRSLVHSGVAPSFVQIQLWVFVVLNVGMLLFFAALVYDASRFLAHH